MHGVPWRARWWPRNWETAVGATALAVVVPTVMDAAMPFIERITWATAAIAYVGQFSRLERRRRERRQSVRTYRDRRARPYWGDDSVFVVGGRPPGPFTLPLDVYYERPSPIVPTRAREPARY